MKRGGVLGASATILAVTAATLPLGALALDAWAGRDVMLSALLGAGLATALAMVSLALAVWSHDKPHPVFLSALVGGFLGKGVILGSGITLLVTLTRLPVVAFMAGLFSYYVLLQVLEIRALRRLFGTRSARAH